MQYVTVLTVRFSMCTRMRDVANRRLYTAGNGDKFPDINSDVRDVMSSLRHVRPATQQQQQQQLWQLLPNITSQRGARPVTHRPARSPPRQATATAAVYEQSPPPPRERCIQPVPARRFASIAPSPPPAPGARNCSHSRVPRTGCN